MRSKTSKPRLGTRKLKVTYADLVRWDACWLRCPDRHERKLLDKLIKAGRRGVSLRSAIRAVIYRSDGSWLLARAAPRLVNSVGRAAGTRHWSDGRDRVPRYFRLGRLQYLAAVNYDTLTELLGV